MNNVKYHNLASHLAWHTVVELLCNIYVLGVVGEKALCTMSSTIVVHCAAAQLCCPPAHIQKDQGGLNQLLQELVQPLEQVWIYWKLDCEHNSITLKKQNIKDQIGLLVTGPKKDWS